MEISTTLLVPDQLPAITFNGLAGPDQSWSCGNTRLISDAGSCLERLTSICATPEVAAQLVELGVSASASALAPTSPILVSVGGRANTGTC